MLKDVSNAEKGGENYDMDVPPKLKLWEYELGSLLKGSADH